MAPEYSGIVSAGHRAVIEPSKRLPELALPSLPGGGLVRLRPPGRRSPLLVLVHAGACDACAAFVAEIAAAGERMRDWDGYPIVVRQDEEGAGTGGLPGLLDADRRLPAALAVTVPAVVVADQWGEMHQRYEAGEEHRFPPMDELVEWLRFLAIQCPECQAESF